MARAVNIVGEDLDALGFLCRGEILLMRHLEGHRHVLGIATIAGKFCDLCGLELARSVAIHDPAEIRDAITNGVILRRRRGQPVFDLRRQAAA